MTNAISSFGTLLKIGDGGATETFTTIAEVQDISGPSFSLDTAEVTSHSSAGGWKEYIGTLVDGGEVSFDINFLPTETTHGYSAGLLKDLVNKTVRNFQLVFPDASSTTWQFAALVTKFETSEPYGDKLSASVTLKLTGQPTLA